MALAQMGLVGPKQGYETFKLLVEALGFNSPERFAMDPASPEYAQHMAQMAAQPHQQAPQVQAAQIRAQTTVQQEQAENQRLLLKMQAEEQSGNNNSSTRRFKPSRTGSTKPPRICRTGRTNTSRATRTEKYSSTPIISR